MAFSSNILPTEAAYYTLTNASLVNGRLSLQSNGTAEIKIDKTRMYSVTSNILVNVYADRLLNPLTTPVIMYLDIEMATGEIQQVGIYPNQIEDKALSYVISLTDGDYKECTLCIKAYVPCDLLIYEICTEQESDVSTIIDGVKQSLPHVLYDYNETNLTVEQDETSIALIACALQGNTDINGHFLMDFYATEQCDVYLRFYDNEIEELYAPLKYTVTPGHNSIGVPHAYLKRLAGIHTLVVTCQCTNGKLSMYVRGVLFTIDAGHLAEGLIDAGMLIQDITCKHITIGREPEELWAIGIDANELLIKARPFSAEPSTNWTPLYSFGYYAKAAIEFNGTWTKIPKQSAYTIITDEEPYIFAIDDLHNLYVWQGNNEADKMLLDINVQEVHALRGYSSIIYPGQDQGLICAYLKGGKVYIRPYTYFNEKYAWANAYVICEEETEIIDFSIHRLNDYRIGIAYSTENNNYWVISDRTYVNQAIPTEEVETIPNAERCLTSMTTLPLPSNVGTPCTFEDPTLPQKEFYITYELPLGTLIETYEMAERLRQVFAVTLNGKAPEIYDIVIRENQVYIILQEEAAATRDKECEVKVVINNQYFDVFLRTSDNGHGIPACCETITWVIERPITTINVNANESVELAQKVVASELLMKPIIKKRGYTSDSETITPAFIEATFSFVPVIEPIVSSYELPADTQEITPALVEATLECIQTGITPV